MLTGLAIYLGGMALTALLVWSLPSPGLRPLQWAIALSLWPLTMLGLMAIGTRR